MNRSNSQEVDLAGECCGWPEAPLFDLDGTPVDSAPNLASAINIVLSEVGHAPLAIDEVRAMIGNGSALSITPGIYRGLAASKVLVAAPSSALRNILSPPDASRIGP